MKRPRKTITLRPVHPNAGLRAWYRRQLLKLVDEMCESYLYWVEKAYEAHPPTTMAQDATPAAEIARAIKQLRKRWMRNFNTAAEQLAAYYLTKVEKRSRAVLKKILKDGGFSVEFKVTPALKDVIKASTIENVALIRSIPEQFHTQVEGLVMRSVTAGRDLAPLTRQLRKQFGVTRRRAELISRDQNNKVTAAITRARYLDMGFEQAIWLHSHGGNKPRPTHLANSGKRFNVAEGWYDPDPKVRRHIHPGELINCFPSSTEIEFAYDVEKAFRRRYRGELSEIVTDSGKTLAATSNHPILTPHGWRPIGALHNGDYVIEIAKDDIFSIVPERDENHAPTLIGALFDAIAEAGRRRSEISLRDQFHGDGSADGDVEIVDPARCLSLGGQPGFDEGREYFSLAMAALPALGSSLSDHLGMGSDGAPPSFVSGYGEPLAPFDAFVVHPDLGGLATAPDVATSLDDHSTDGSAVKIVFTRKGKNAAPLLVFSTKKARVISARKKIFDGHVFNLQTASGWYAVAGGIISHNCRCVCKPVVKGFS